MKPEESLEKVQEEIKLLFAKQLQMNKYYQEKLKAYEEYKTLYQRLFGKEPLPKDLELEAINTQIADLKEVRGRIYNILEVGQHRIS
jgi:hypothetical protein